MLILYDKNTTSFNSLGLGVLKDFKSEPLITEVLNGLFNLEFDYIKNGWLSDSLVEENIIKANGQLFRIWNIKKSTDATKITILAKHIWFDLEKCNFLEDVAPTDKTGDNALAWILDRANLQTPFRVTGDCAKVASARYVRVYPIDAIYNADNALLKRFGGELEIDNYDIKLHNKRGNDLGLEIRQRKNLKGADYQLDLSTVATRIMPIGKDGILLPEKYIDSPLIENYFAPFFYKYEVDIGVDEENGITLENCYDKMREAVQVLYAGGIDKPTVSISVDFVELSKTKEYEQYSNLETAHLGDSCKVYIPSLNLNLTTRIVKTVYNCSKKRLTKIELGTTKPNYVSSKVDSDNAIKNTLDKDSPNGILQQAKETASSVIKHPFKGYLYISEEMGELYLMDTNDIKTAQKIWKFGLGGIGYSSAGINGNYELAITQDGQIVADFITVGTISANRVEGYNQLQIKVSDIDKTVEDNYTELNQTINNFMFSVKNAGGPNLLQNSVMFSYNSTNNPTSWDISGAGTLEIKSSSESLSFGGISGNVFILNNKTVRQRVSVRQDSSDIPLEEKLYYTFSTKIKKDSAGTGYVKISNANEEYIINLNNGDNPYFSDYEIKELLPTMPYYDIEFFGSEDSNITFTDSMFSLGKYKTQWAQATGEVMNTQVNINQNGVLVKSSVFTGNYTVMSPLEFAGYSLVAGIPTKVFTLNQEITEIKKLKVFDEISMPPLKIVPITTGKVQGWAIVPTLKGDV